MKTVLSLRCYLCSSIWLQLRFGVPMAKGRQNWLYIISQLVGLVCRPNAFEPLHLIVCQTGLTNTSRLDLQATTQQNWKAWVIGLLMILVGEESRVKKDSQPVRIAIPALDNTLHITNRCMCVLYFVQKFVRILHTSCYTHEANTS